MNRKFLVNSELLEKELNVNNYDRKSINKLYIPGDEVEIFVTKIESNLADYKCFMLIEGKGCPEDRNVEIEIPYAKYRKIRGWKLYKGNMIDIIRYNVPINKNLTIDIDIYDGQLFGLVVVEVDFETEEDVEFFKSFDWVCEEITDDEKYNDKNLVTMNLLKPMKF